MAHLGEKMVKRTLHTSIPYVSKTEKYFDILCQGGKCENNIDEPYEASENLAPHPHLLPCPPKLSLFMLNVKQSRV